MAIWKFPPSWIRAVFTYKRGTRKKLTPCVITIVIILYIFLSINSESKPMKYYPYNTYSGKPLTIYDNPYFILPNRSCDSSSPIKLLIVIHSKVTNFEKRNTIRNTWANRALLSRMGFRVFFFLGMPFDEDMQSIVSEESSKYDDVIQGNFYDSYLNITHKAVLVLRWITENCNDQRFVLKVDDDVFVNVFLLHRFFLPNIDKSPSAIWCDVQLPETQKISRKEGAKHRVPDHHFRGLTHYPFALCRGYFVLSTSDNIGVLYKAAKETPFFWIDDVYLFGTLVNKTGIKLAQIEDKLGYETRAFRCFQSRDKLCPYLGVLLGSHVSMEKLWTLGVNQMNWYHRKLKVKE